jgi:antitoxin component YwqK of YwqJK toxin-antitoxin module
MKKKLLTASILYCMICIPSYGQEGTYYYGSNLRPMDNLEEATSYKVVRKLSSRKYNIETHQKINGKWMQASKEKIRLQDEMNQRIYYNANTFFPKKIFRQMERISPEEYLFSESNLTSTIRTGTSSSFLPLHLEGTVTEYYPNGEKKSVSLFRNNQLISNENWLSDGSKYIDSVFYSVDKEPEYQMGDEFFKAYLLSKLRESKLDLTQIEDLVVIGWVIMETGEIDGIIALKGKSTYLNEFLVNTISDLPGYWTPAIMDGKKVRYFMSIPLNFIQNETNFQELEFSGGVIHYDWY